MRELAWITFAALVAVGWSVYAYREGWKDGRECGRAEWEKWWLQQGSEVDEMRKQIWKEEETRWP